MASLGAGGAQLKYSGGMGSQPHIGQIRCTLFYLCYQPQSQALLSVQTMIRQILGLYALDSPKWDDISNLASELGWTELIAQTTSEY